MVYTLRHKGKQYLEEILYEPGNGSWLEKFDSLKQFNTRQDSKLLLNKLM